MDDQDLQEHDPDSDPAVDESGERHQPRTAMYGPTDPEAPQGYLQETRQECRDGEVEGHAEEAGQTRMIHGTMTPVSIVVRERASASRLATPTGSLDPTGNDLGPGVGKPERNHRDEQG
jgi:hypothetical protein